MILNFDKPKKVRSTKEHNDNHMSDSGVAGTYVPNMSKEDNERFKAKYIKGDEERVEIRVGRRGVNILIKVYKEERVTKSDDWREKRKDHKHVLMSMNGTADLTISEWEEITIAVSEAENLLHGLLTLEDFN